MPYRTCLFALVAVCAASFELAATAQEPDEAGIEYFEQHIRPLLAERCLKCHSPASETIGGNLYLDSHRGWTMGGDLGQAIMPGDPDASLLVQAVRHTSDDVQMPPDGRLSEHEISLLVHWIEMGAPDPRTATGRAPGTRVIDLDAGRRYWAFIPPVSARRSDRLPGVRPEWISNEVDEFVLAPMERRGLHPVERADRLTLIRRATFDLTGLPPTPDEIDAFLADSSPAAYGRLVDRLLASPRYGERWGRYWLDVARYADSNGLDENVAHGNAWRYRNYVIESFAADQPFDQFLIEQLAGDLLEPAGDQRIDHRRAIATGFLSLGPKVLAEVDESKMEMDIVDEQVDTVGRAFLGLTLGCARCHDHKFDPIRTEDYYAMAGIFKSTRTMEHFTKIARWNEVVIATEAERAVREAAERRVADLRGLVDQLVEAANAELREQLGEGAAFPDKPETQYDAKARDELNRLREELTQLEAAVPELPTAMGVGDVDHPADVRVHVRGSHLAQGAVVSRGFPLVLVSDEASSLGLIPDGASGRLELARWLVDDQNPLTARVMVNRIWRWHFGRGLVESTDNFGQLGSSPTNQPLLDWLALRFVADGWSIKSMHRTIMLSATYQRSSRHDAALAALDPENRFLWRAPVRRLSAEAIRDSALMVGERLNLEQGTSLLHVKNREFLFNHTSKDETTYDAPLRSIYLPVIRNHLYDAFQLFDYSDASVMNSSRTTTTVAPQALFMMNSELVDNAARGLAARVLQAPTGDDAERVSYAYRLAFGRNPRPQEQARAVEYLEQFYRGSASYGDDHQQAMFDAWRLICHTLLAASEFVYVR